MTRVFEGGRTIIFFSQLATSSTRHCGVHGDVCTHLKLSVHTGLAGTHTCTHTCRQGLQSPVWVAIPTQGCRIR